jgi:hypothetical protein
VTAIKVQGNTIKPSGKHRTLVDFFVLIQYLHWHKECPDGPVVCDDGILPQRPEVGRLRSLYGSIPRVSGAESYPTYCFMSCIQAKPDRRFEAATLS